VADVRSRACGAQAVLKRGEVEARCRDLEQEVYDLKQWYEAFLLSPNGVFGSAAEVPVRLRTNVECSSRSVTITMSVVDGAPLVLPPPPRLGVGAGC
jgi:hypothetical protein